MPIPADAEGIENFIRAYLQPESLHAAHDVLPQSAKDRMIRKPSLQAYFEHTIPFQASPSILICSHGGRDRRCGVMGPLLQAEFERTLRRTGDGPYSNAAASGLAATDHKGAAEQAPSQFPENAGSTQQGARRDQTEYRTRVGLISHIGGHKFAGNVIIYIPSNFSVTGMGSNPLGGHGIWYGRVEPRHVQGIVQKTLLEGKIIQELFRGGTDNNGQVLRL